jgi:matrix metalloproteinase-14 (membrane-inserted)
MFKDLVDPVGGMAMSLYDTKLVRQLVKKQNVEDSAVEFALKYISYYFHNPAEGELTEDVVPEYVKHFQEMIGVEADGNLDSQVVKAMQTLPRCGCRDYSLIQPEAAGNAPRWGLPVLKYYVEKYVTGLSTTDQDDLIKMAFGAWNEVAQIAVTRVGSPNGANIIISNGRGQADQFDGPSGTLAWAYLPPQVNFTGQLLMRFDLDETWIKNSTDRGILYLNVATHEFGHLLGLEHSQVSKALMAPYYAVGITKPQQNDDIPRIQALYGAQVTPPPLPTPAPTPVPTPPPAPGKVKVEIYVDSLSDIKINGKDTTNFDLI